MHLTYKPVFTDGRINEDVIITKPFGNDKMTCREIRRNSAGCIKLKDECEKCKEIQHIGKCDTKIHNFTLYYTAQKRQKCGPNLGVFDENSILQLKFSFLL